VPRLRTFEVSYGATDLRSIQQTSCESFLGLTDPYETSKVLNLGTGFVENRFFLECMSLPYIEEKRMIMVILVKIRKRIIGGAVE
jgi:hypothetical protein